MPATSPYGTWKSRISAELITAQQIRFGDLQMVHSDIYWSETRPRQGGRAAVLRLAAGAEPFEMLPDGFSARSRVHEYGGGAFTVAGEEIFFVNDGDQRIYQAGPDGQPEAITPPGASRYADLLWDSSRSRLIAVCEDHADPSQEPVNSLVSIELGPDYHIRRLAGGNDFYASPCLSPDGGKLAWISWNHPNMPWDGSELWIAELEPDGAVAGAHRIAGGAQESIFQPSWSPSGQLYFVSDRSGWWNLYRWEAGVARPLHPMSAEFGLPQWVFAMSTYGFLDEERILCTYYQQGRWNLGILDASRGMLEPIETVYTRIHDIRTDGGKAVFIAAAPGIATEIVRLDPTSRRFERVRASTKMELDPGAISMPEAIRFQTADGEVAHGYYYSPWNPEFLAATDEQPPLLVLSHGGPTSAASDSLDLRIQYWTSRGFAVLDVNYRGSSGYGRAYRNRLRGQWGVLDVDDCIAGARHLVERNQVDANRLAIRGSSAGGYTTLSALTFRDRFRAGASYYGIGDLEALAVDTHKFESRYLDTLIAPYPDGRALYLERSPIHFVDRLDCPIIFFQGLEDRVVPSNQAETMVAALRSKGLPVAYLPFAGEGHGFRMADSIRRSLEAEYYFYSQIFGFEAADEIEPVPIENLGSWQRDSSRTAGRPR